MKDLNWFYRMSFLSFLWITVNAISAQAEPASLFKPIVDDIQRQLPSGLKMRLPAYLPHTALALHPFVQANSKGLQVYLSPEADCNQPKCSVGGIAVFTQEGFSPWSRQLEKGTPVSLPNGIQGYYLALGKAKDADHYILWQQDGFGFVLGTDRHSISQPELIQIAASTVVEPPLGELDQGANVLILAQPKATRDTPMTRPFPQQPSLPY